LLFARPIALFLLLCTGGTAFAQETPDPVAEYRRLSTAMSSLAAKNAWDGVERNFNQMIELGQPVSPGDWLTGAQSAREVGDITTAHSRLMKGQEAGGSEEITSWLTEIKQTYSEVQLMCDPGATPLTIDPMPFQPDRVKAVEFAQALIQSKGVFEGLLPEGDYEMGILPVEVIPGDPLVVVDVRTEAKGGRGRGVEDKKGKDGAPGDGGEKVAGDWGLDFIPGKGGSPTLYGVKAGSGSNMGMVGAAFTVRPGPDWSFGVGLGIDVLAGSISGAFDVRRRLPDNRFYAAAQVGPMQWRGSWATPGSAKAFYGPSLGAGYELATKGLLLDVGGGLGMAVKPQGVRLGFQWSAAVGQNF